MKYKILLSALLCSSLLSCKKDKDNPAPSAESQCYVKSVSYSEDDQTYHLYYTQIRSQDGKTADFTYSDDSDLSSSQIKYAKAVISDKYIIGSLFDKNKNPFGINDTIWINEKKLPFKAIEHFNFDNGSIIVDRTDYYYENDVLVKTITQRSEDGEPSERIKLFTYTNGNCSQTREFENKGGVDVHDTTYVDFEYYLDKPAQKELMYEFGNPGKYLIKRVIETRKGQFEFKHSVNYTYEVNPNGLVTKQTVERDGEVYFTKYEYTCQ
ncbi:MAG: hypothetical protein J7604_04120 [Sporocytophaga sp.]|uniref:hypothetical protein n=1 Tax=Sporocytophaga sp. TaxID=2231183 RepID=UPI001B023FD6|nr:hypothetical protein [Sporocytophaga sp.]MBO9699370.1 hypothetical protein [Sporocytophaga sp.]